MSGVTARGGPDGCSEQTRTSCAISCHASKNSISSAMNGVSSSSECQSSKTLHLVTPLLKSRKLSDKVGANVWLKLENVQNSGSFKIRGLGHFCTKVCSVEGVCVVAMTTYACIRRYRVVALSW